MTNLFDGKLHHDKEVVISKETAELFEKFLVEGMEDCDVCGTEAGAHSFACPKAIDEEKGCTCDPGEPFYDPIYCPEHGPQEVSDAVRGET